MIDYYDRFQEICGISKLIIAYEILSLMSLRKLNSNKQAEFNFESLTLHRV